MRLIKKLSAGILVLLIAASLAYSQSNSDFMFTKSKTNVMTDYSAIDNYVKGLTIPVSMSYENAVKQITKTCRTEKEKARAIFDFMAFNISYNTAKINAGGTFTYSSQAELEAIYAQRARETWNDRNGVCEGYGRLFVELCKAAGLNAEYISGYDKKYAHTYGKSVGNHGWNVVHVGNEHILLDSCWGAGDTNGDTFTRNFKDSWFDVDPYVMIFSHYPKEDKYQYLTPAVPRAKFDTTPRIDPTISVAGVTGQELFSFFMTHNRAWSYTEYKGLADALRAGVRFNKILFTGSLKKGNSYTINLSFPSSEDLYISVDGSYKQLASNKDFTFTPTIADKNVILARRSGNSFISLLFYKVENSPSITWESAARQASASTTMPSIVTGNAGGNNSGNQQNNSGNNNNQNSGNQNNNQGNQQNQGGLTTSSGLTLLNQANLAKTEYTLLDGTKVNNVANGKTKVIVFFKTNCGNCMNTTNTVSKSYDKFSGIDIFEVEINKADKSKVQTFANTYDTSKKLKFAYSTGTDNNSSMWSYLRAAGKGNGSITLPVVVYIDANNKLQYVENGAGITADKILAKVNEIEAATKTNRNTTPNNGNQNGNQNGGNQNNNQGNQQNQGNLTTSSGLTLLNKDNLAKIEYTLLDGKKVNNVASGKTKVIVFFQTICGNCMNTTRTISSAYDKFNGIDIFEVEINRADKAKVQEFANKYDTAKKLKFTYSTEWADNTSMWNYLRAAGKGSGSITLPVVVYIDANNKLQYVEYGAGITADKIIAKANEIEAATKTNRNTTPNNGNQNGNQNNNNQNSNQNGSNQNSNQGTQPPQTNPGNSGTQQSLNKFGLPYDPNAVADKSVQELGGFYLLYNYAYDYVYFRDSTKKINYGTYDLKEQYWVVHNKEIDDAEIPLEKLYSKIDLKKTTLNRDKDGKCVGKDCTATPEPQQQPQPQPEKTTGSLNSAGLPYDPNAVVDTSMNKKTLDGFLLSFDTKSNTVSFYSNSVKTKKPYGVYNYKEQFWSEYSKEIEKASIRLEKLYKKINLSITTLNRDKKGKCVGEDCTVTQPDPKPQVTETKKLLNAANLAETKLTLTNGSTETNKANGKTKVLMFFNTTCTNCRNTTGTISGAYDKFKGIDFIEAEVNGSKKEVVLKYSMTYDKPGNIKFAYSTGSTNNSLMWSYLKAAGNNNGSITLPVVVYIDANNKLQYVENGAGITADKILAKVKEIEDATGTVRPQEETKPKYTGPVNSYGLPYDPNAKLNPAKNGYKVDGITATYNTTSGWIYFRDSSRNLLGSYSYTEQYWQIYDSKLDLVPIDLAMFYSSIDLSKTELNRDKNGNCVGNSCSVTSGSGTQKPTETKPVQKNGPKNTLGLPYDPNAKIDMSKNNTVIAGIEVTYNVTSCWIYFRDTSSARKPIIGSFNYRDQYWNAYDKKLENLGIYIDSFYTSIDLSLTELNRDRKGNPVK